MKNKNNQGFTLFEMMIVLVAIGLLIGGGLAGRALIKSAGLKNLNSEIQGIKMAIGQFRTEYGAIPGDFADATDYWGVANITPSTCYTQDKSQAILTCDGNGNGEVQVNQEMFLFWHHLANAKLIQGEYTGAVGTSNTEGTPDGLDHDIGRNSPASKFATGTGFGVRWLGNTSALNGWFDGGYGHILMFGKELASEDNLPRNPALTSEEAKKFDEKFDDGYPAKGNIVTRTGSNTLYNDCTQVSASDNGNTGSTTLDAVYALSGDTDADDSKNKVACQLIIRNIVEGF